MRAGGFPTNSKYNPVFLHDAQRELFIFLSPLDFVSGSNILKYKPGLFLHHSLRYCNYQTQSLALYLERSHDHSGYSKHTVQRMWGIIWYVYMARFIQILHTYLLLQYSEYRRLWYWACSDGSFFFFLNQALKNSGRLIKSEPQAAAPIGSSQWEIHSQKKGEDALKFTNLYFFLLLLPLGSL